MLISHFVAIWKRYEYFKSDKVLENCPKCAKMTNINLREELGYKSTTFDTGTSMKQILVRY